jgi:hypothetical protein
VATITVATSQNVHVVMMIYSLIAIVTFCSSVCRVKTVRIAKAPFIKADSQIESMKFCQILFFRRSYSFLKSDSLK